MYNAEMDMLHCRGLLCRYNILGTSMCTAKLNRCQTGVCNVCFARYLRKLF